MSPEDHTTSVQPSTEAAPESTTAAPATASSSRKSAAGAKARPGMKAAVGTAVAAATLAAVTVFSGGAAVANTESTASRIAGVQQDLARAVALQQVTSEQAAAFEKQMVRRIQSQA
jgi:copper(I)-binding protein